MEALLDKLNVRDLLPSPSSPLSPHDLRLLISRLDAHSETIKSTIRSHLTSNYGHFASLFSLCSDVASKTDVLSKDVVLLLTLVSDNADVAGMVREIVERKKELREKSEALTVVGAILELDGKLGVIGELLNKGRVLEAAQRLREVMDVIGQGDGVTKEGEPVVYGLLRKKLSDCFDKMHELILVYMENAVRYDQETNTLKVKHCGTVSGTDGIELATVMQAMDVANTLDYGLAKIADLIAKYVLTPVVSFKATPTIVDESFKDSSDAILKMVSAVDFEASKVNGEIMYSHVFRMIEFINKCLCFNNASWMRCFGRLTWPGLSKTIISNFLSKVVPDDASKLAEFQEIRKVTIDFEKSLKELIFISPSDTKDEKLSNYADNVELHFASRKKVQILGRARNMLLQSNFTLRQDDAARISVSDKEHNAERISNQIVLLFTSEKCVVSEAAKQLMELVHQALQDVCLLPPKVGSEFYHTARDALSLYEAIVPVKLEKQLDSINQAAVLIHNDCVYLSQEILGLAFQYRPYFPGSLKELAVFIDLAPKFQLMAEEVLLRQIQLVIDNLNQAIDGADGFQNTHQIKQYESAKFSIDQVSFIIEKVHIIWEPLLLPSVYEKSIAIILETVFSRIAKEILFLDDMAAEETLQHQRLIHLLFEHLSSLLEPLLAVDERTTSKEAQKSRDYLVLSIRKLRKLAELLDMPLKSITASWESGELAECNFKASEVEDFIRAIFTDSPLRKECLFRIENT